MISDVVSGERRSQQTAELQHLRSLHSQPVQGPAQLLIRVSSVRARVGVPAKAPGVS